MLCQVALRCLVLRISVPRLTLCCSVHLTIKYLKLDYFSDAVPPHKSKDSVLGNGALTLILTLILTLTLTLTLIIILTLTLTLILTFPKPTLLSCLMKPRGTTYKVVQSCRINGTLIVCTWTESIRYEMMDCELLALFVVL